MASNVIIKGKDTTFKEDVADDDNVEDVIIRNLMQAVSHDISKKDKTSVFMASFSRIVHLSAFDRWS